MARSVLRVADQLAGIYPDCCVLSGAQTAGAVRVTATSWGGPRWLLGLPGFALVAGNLPRHEHLTIALPVSDRVWKMWRFRDVASSAILAAGIVVFGIGVVTATAGLGGFGLLIGVGAVAYRARAHHNYWFTCIVQPATSTIVVEPSHQRFDEQERAVHPNPALIGCRSPHAA